MDVLARTNNADSETKEMSLSEIGKEFDRLISDLGKKPPSKPPYAYNLNPPVNNDPTFLQQQNDSLCLQLFTQIQSIREELADHVLVEPMAVRSILLAGFWEHLNFKAKHKDADDSSSAIYFAELDTIRNKVTCLIKLDIDLSADTSAYERCAFCHPTPEGKDLPVSGVGCVYHPVDAKLFLN